MQQLLIYEGKVAIVLTVFFLFFRIMLAKERLHRLNRSVLVCTVIVSFILPLCVITVHRTLPAPEMNLTPTRESVVRSLQDGATQKQRRNRHSTEFRSGR